MNIKMNTKMNTNINKLPSVLEKNNIKVEVNNKSLKNVSSYINENTAKIEGQNRMNEVELRYAGESEEVKLYDDSYYKFDESFRSTYTNENGEVTGASVDNVFKKYGELYKEIEESDISEKDKDIKFAALEDSFKMNAEWCARETTRAMNIYELNLKPSESSKLDKVLPGGKKEFFLKQRIGVSKAVAELSQQLIDLFKSNINGEEKTSSLNTILEKSSKISSQRDYMSTRFVEGIDVKQDKEKNKEWFGNYSGYKRIVEKYGLGNEANC